MSTIGYVRVSTAKQQDGNGPEQQRASICAWAMAGKDRQIDDWVFEYESGTKEDREEILRLLELAKSGAVTRIVVDRMDRLGRRLVVCESLIQRFQEAGAEVVCTQVQLGNSPTDVLVRQMMGVLAEYQRSEWLARMKACRKLAVTKRGKFHGGRPPIGYLCAGEGRLKPNPKTAPAVVRMFELRAKGVALQGICRVLEHEGHGSWFPMQVKRVLDKEQFYRGKRPLGDNRYDRGVTPLRPAILTGEPFMHAVSEDEEDSAVGAST